MNTISYADVAMQDWRQLLVHLKAIDLIAKRLRQDRDSIQFALPRTLPMKRYGEDGDTVFREVISLAETLGMERILADIHPDPIDRARRVSRGSARPAWTHLHRPLFALKSPCTGQTHARVIPGTLPTTKEREVLQLLAGGLSNKEIALALGIGEETVKWHLKNLFGKFDVGTRKHLLGRARVLGILDAVS